MKKRTRKLEAEELEKRRAPFTPIMDAGEEIEPQPPEPEGGGGMPPQEAMPTSTSSGPSSSGTSDSSGGGTLDKMASRLRRP